MKAPLFAAALFLATACENRLSDCAVNVSGVDRVAGDYDCETDVNTVEGFEIASSEEGVSFHANIAVPTHLTPGTFSSDDVGAAGVCSVDRGVEGGSWLASRGTADPDRGSYRLEVTSVTNRAPPMPDGGLGSPFFLVHGKLTCEVPGVVLFGGVGTVQVSATF